MPSRRRMSLSVFKDRDIVIRGSCFVVRESESRNTNMELTSERFESTGLTIRQPAKGHRYGEASLLLADFCNAEPHERMAEFGSGVAVVALQVASRSGSLRVVAIELQEELHRIAMKNVAENRMEDRVICVNDDWRRFASDNPLSFDVIISNPPFYAAGRSRHSADPQRAAARHEVAGTVSDLIASARTALRPHGRLDMVFTKSRKDELLRAASNSGFRMTRYEDSLNDVFLVEFNI